MGMSLCSPARHFNDTPVAVYNCDTVEVVGSEFLNNTAHGTLVDLPFRTNAGGIAYTVHNRVNASLRITKCVFINNSALQTVAVNPDITESRVLKLFVGRGGGICAAVFMVEQVDILVENCNFTRNLVEQLGGGLYITTQGNATRHHYAIVNCTFVENAALVAGGGIGLAFFPPGARHTMNQIQLRHSTFVRNRAAEFGGAAYILPGTLFNVHCMFIILLILI